MVHIMGTIMSPMLLPLLFRASSSYLVIVSFPVFVINRFARNAIDPSVVFTDYIIFYPTKHAIQLGILVDHFLCGNYN